MQRLGGEGAISAFHSIYAEAVPWNWRSLWVVAIPESSILALGYRCPKVDELEQQQQGMRERLKASVHTLQQRNRHCQALQASNEADCARLVSLQAEEKSLQCQCSETAARRVMASSTSAPWRLLSIEDVGVASHTFGHEYAQEYGCPVKMRCSRK